MGVRGVKYLWMKNGGKEDEKFFVFFIFNCLVWYICGFWYYSFVYEEEFGFMLICFLV